MKYLLSKHLLVKHCMIYLLPLLIMVFIFVQSALPADLSSEESSFIVDFICRFIKADPEIITVIVRKTAHFLEYFALGMSLLAALFTGVEGKRRGGLRLKRREGLHWIMLPAGIIGVAYAVSDEIHQHFVPERSCELRDILIDSAGVACGVLISYLFVRKITVRKRCPNEENRCK